MIIARAPLRIPLGGGGTDLPSYYAHHGGFVLSVAINKYVYISVVEPAIGESIILKYSSIETVKRVDEVQQPLMREALRFLELERPIVIDSIADVPSGTGMGSSGSFLVALLLALHTVKRDHVSQKQLAEEACFVEMERVRQPAGKQDQFIGALGGITVLDIDRTGSVHTSPLTLAHGVIEDLQSNLLLFYTGIRRQSFDILQEQARDTARGVDRVVESLHRTKAIGLDIKAALEAGALDDFGRLLHVHWEAKKARSEAISGAVIDRWYDIARRQGALGGKLMGAGGGGFFVFYCPPESRAPVRAAMADEGLQEVRYRFDFEGAKVLVNF
ncbi:MAG: galactokinase [Candidatus Rokubacteria bacterium]|nr:galactokinase [Candidatus Rokubacteria bacterium]